MIKATKTREHKFKLKNQGPNYVSVRFDRAENIWCVTPVNSLIILDVKESRKKEKMVQTIQFKGDPNTVKSKAEASL